MSKLRPFGRLCSACRAVVPGGSHICPTCHASQGWRSFVSVSNTTLALLVALITVATPALNAGLPLLKSPGSDIDLVLESASPAEMTFVAKNSGRSGGVLRINNVSIDVARHDPDNYFIPIQVPFETNNLFIEPSRELRLTARLQSFSSEDVCKKVAPALERALSLAPRLRSRVYEELGDEGQLESDLDYDWTLRLACTVNSRETSFKSHGEKILPVQCDEFDFLNACWISLVKTQQGGN
jgi:hypothetical protein